MLVLRIVRGAAVSILLVLGLLAPAGCGGSGGGGGGGGRPRAVPARAADPAGGAGGARIVSLAPSATEILFRLGGGDALVGVSRLCDEPPEAREKPNLGDPFRPNLERLLLLQPDRVLVLPGCDLEQALGRVAPGIRVDTVRCETMDQTFDAIARLGDLVEHPGEARALVASLRRGLEGWRRLLADRPRVRTLLVLDRKPLWAVGRGSFLDDLIRIAGGENVVQADRGRWVRLSLEEVLAADPEVILEASPGTGRLDPGFWSRFARLRAVRHGRVHVLAGFSAFRPGPRILEAVGQIAGFLHPGVAAMGGGQ